MENGKLRMENSKTAGNSPFSTINSQLCRSESRRIYEIRSFPNVRPEWDKLSTDEKRRVLVELDGDFTPSWALQVIKDVTSQRSATNRREKNV